MRKLFSILVVMSLLVGVVGSVSGSDHDTVTGYVVHGIPGLDVDVYIDGELFVKDFAPDTVAGPLKGPGDRDARIDIVPAGGDPAQPALSATLSFPAGSNVSIVAHLTEDGEPTLSVFDNDVSNTGEGQTRLIVRHVAAAPAVDALFFPGTTDELRVGPLSNGEQVVETLPAGNYTAVVVPTGTSDEVYGPLSSELRAGSVYIGYAVGNLDDGTFKFLTQQIYVGE